MKFRIRTKIFLAFVITGLILTVAGTFLLYYFFTNTLKESISAHLETAVNSRSHHIKTFLDREKGTVEDLALIGKVERLLLTEKTDINYDNQVNDVNERLQKTVNSSEAILSIEVLDKNGIMIASTNESMVTDMGHDEIFLNSKESTYIRDIYFSEFFSDVVMCVGTPILSNDKFLGVIIADLNLDELFEITLDRIGLGETGEIYLVNKDNYMISPSRFKEDVILRQKVDTVSSRNCFSMAKHPEEHIGHQATEVFKDYRDVNVLGAHSYISDMNWCLLAEINEREIMSSVRKVLLVGSIIALCIIFVIYIAAAWMSGKISKPIKILRQGIKQIEEGNLDYKVGTDSQDEIGELSRAFDKMIRAVKKSRAEVDKKVKEQTKEIVEKQKTLLNLLEDIDKEKNLASKERDKIEAILYSIGDGVFVVDNNYKIIIFNKAATDISGFSSKEVIGKRYNQVLKFIYEKNEKAASEFITKAITSGEISEISNHALLIKKDGNKIPVADSAAPIKNKKGEIVGCVVVFQNVTKEREIDRAKSEFISLASHQLRTPLTGIKWFVGLLLGGKAGEVSKDQKDFLQEIFASNERMIKLVSDLLDVSRIETGRKFDIELKLTDIAALIKSVINEQKSLIQKKKIVVNLSSEFSKQLKLSIDENKIQQVFQNLISNAIKYSKNKGSVEIGYERKKKDEAIFYVKDYGLGIPKEQQKKVFEKFFRADNVVTLYTDGTGLGLYIAKAIVEAHGGRIWFESSENKGTTFYFALPV